MLVVWLLLLFIILLLFYSTIPTATNGWFSSHGAYGSLLSHTHMQSPAYTSNEPTYNTQPETPYGAAKLSVGRLLVDWWATGVAVQEEVQDVELMSVKKTQSQLACDADTDKNSQANYKLGL